MSFSNIFLNREECKKLILEQLKINNELLENEHYGLIKHPYIYGNIGIGKSYLVKEIAEEKNKKLSTIILSSMLPYEIKGLFYIDDKLIKSQNISNITNYIYNKEKLKIIPYNKIFPEKNSILFIDEINAVDWDIQITLTQLLQERTMFDSKLDDSVDIILAGNDRESDMKMYDLIIQIQDRIVMFTYVPSIEEIKNIVKYYSIIVYELLKDSYELFELIQRNEISIRKFCSIIYIIEKYIFTKNDIYLKLIKQHIFNKSNKAYNIIENILLNKKQINIKEASNEEIYNYFKELGYDDKIIYEKIISEKYGNNKE